MTTISEERAKLAAKGLVLIRRSEWGSIYDYSDVRAVDEPATDQFVHITITDPSAYASDNAHARAIEAIGKARFPNTGGSYNRMHFRSGKAMELQPIGRRGAHTVNDDHRTTCATTGCPSKGKSVGDGGGGDRFNLNFSARAYVICQNVDDSVTAAQLDALARSMAGDRLAGFVTLNARIHGHRCVSAKGCPGDKMWQFMDDLNVKIDYYLTNGLDDMAMPQEDFNKMLAAAFKNGPVRDAFRNEILLGDQIPNRPTVDGNWASNAILSADGVVDAPAHAPDRDTNPHWTGTRVLQETADGVVYTIPETLQRIEDAIADLQPPAPPTP